MRKFVYGFVRPEGTAYRAECIDLPVAVRAGSLDSAVERLRHEVREFLDRASGEALGLDPPPRLLVTFHFTSSQMFV